MAIMDTRLAVCQGVWQNALDIVASALTSPTPAAVERARERRSQGTIRRMDDRQRQEFARRLTARRVQLHLSRLALCEAAGISRMTLRGLERAMQEPQQSTLEKLAEALKTTVLALTGTPSIDPSDPKFRDLTDEDLDIARAFHDASVRIRLRALGVLQERPRRESLTGTVGEWVRRFLALSDEKRAMIAQLINETEQHPHINHAELTPPEPPSPVLRESIADRARQELWEYATKLSEESVINVRDIAKRLVLFEQRMARDQKQKTKDESSISTAARRSKRGRAS